MDINPGPTEAWRVKVLPQRRACKTNKSNDSDNIPKCGDCNLPFPMPHIQEDKNEGKIVKKEPKSATTKANKADKKEQNRELIYFLCRKKNKKKCCSAKCPDPPTITSLASSINQNCCHCVRVFTKYIKDVFRFLLG